MQKCLFIQKIYKRLIRYFWDGGLLSNTPLKELLHAHQEYWKDVENINEIPELEVYIVNVHPSNIYISKIPMDHNGAKDRQNDITYTKKFTLRRT